MAASQPGMENGAREAGPQTLQFRRWPREEERKSQFSDSGIISARRPAFLSGRAGRRLWEKWKPRPSCETNHRSSPRDASNIDPDRAAGSTTYESHEVYFCSDQCRRDFEADPGRYYDRVERQEPPFTVTGGMTAPKFGSAGSGGLENEPVGRPDRG